MFGSTIKDDVARAAAHQREVETLRRAAVSLSLNLRHRRLVAPMGQGVSKSNYPNLSRTRLA